jgi:hypothetical protein
VGRAGSAVEVPERRGTAPPGYKCLEGDIPILHAPRLEAKAREIGEYLGEGFTALSGMLSVGTPEIAALLVADEDWREAPRDNARPYPPGLPYFTRSVEPPLLVLPEALSPVFGPRTEATLPLTVWHELAHAFLLSREVVRTPAWLGEFVPQAASAAIARRAGLSLDAHLSQIGGEPGFTVRSFRGPADPEDQMSFQNLLLLLGVAALKRFGEEFLPRIFDALWEEGEIVDGARAETLLAGALGPGGRGWLASRREF